MNAFLFNLNKNIKKNQTKNKDRVNIINNSYNGNAITIVILKKCETATDNSSNFDITYV